MTPTFKTFPSLLYYNMVATILRNLYTSLEDAFYRMLDFLDERGLPVYRLHDFLDERGIPPFPLFLGVVLLLIGGFIFLTIPQNQYILSIYVEDEEGNPVKGATVKAFLNGEVVAEAYTDDFGYAELKPIPEGEIRIEVDHPAFERTGRTFFVGGDESISITLKQSSAPEEGWGTLELFITDTDGKALHAFVLVEGDTVSTYEANDGKLSLKLKQNVLYTITVKAVGYKEKKFNVTLTTNSDTRMVKLEPLEDLKFLAGNEECRRVNVVVFVAKDGVPQEDVQVELFSPQGGTYRKVTGKDGSVSFKVCAGDYQIKVKDRVSDFFFANEDSIIVADIGTGQFYLKKQIVDNGKPVKNKTVKVGNLEVTTDEEGYALIPLTNSSSIPLYKLTIQAKHRKGPVKVFSVHIKEVDRKLSTNNGKVVTYLPKGNYTLTAYAYGRSVERKVELTDDMEVTMDFGTLVVNTKVSVPLPGIVEVKKNGELYDRKECKETCTFKLELGDEYTYEYKVGNKVLSTGSIEPGSDIVIPKDVMRDSYPDKLSASIGILFKGKEVPVLLKGGYLSILINFPSDEGRTILVEMGGKTLLNKRVSPSPPSLSLKIPTPSLEDGKYTLRVKVLKNGEEEGSFEQEVTLISAPLKEAEGILYLITPTEEVDAINGKATITYIVVGNATLRFIIKDKKEIPVEGFAYGSIDFTVDRTQPLRVEVLKDERIVATEAITLVYREKKPTGTIEWYFTKNGVPSGRVLINGGKLHVRVYTNNEAKSVEVRVQAGVSSPLFKTFSQEISKDAADKEYVDFTFRGFSFTGDIKDVDIKIVATLHYKDNTREEFTGEGTFYATSIPFQNYDGTELWYYVKWEGEEDTISSESVVSLGGFGHGSLELTLNNETISLSLKNEPQVKEKKVELHGEVKATLVWKTDTFETTIMERSLRATEREYSLEVCILWRREDTVENVNNVSLSIEGVTAGGKELTKRTNINGCGIVMLPKGEYTINVSAEGYVPSKKDVAVPTYSRVDIYLTPINEAPKAILKGVKKKGELYASIESGKQYTLLFDYALTPDSTGATLIVEAFKPDGSSEVKTVKVNDLSGEVEVVVPLYDVDGYARISYTLETDKGASYTDTAVIPALGEARCTNGYGSLLSFDVERDGKTYTDVASALEGDNLEVRAYVIRCSLESSSAKLTLSFGDKKKDISITLKPFDVKEVTLRVKNVKEGSYAAKLQIFSKDGAVLYTNTRNITVLGDRTVFVRVNEGFSFLFKEELPIEVSLPKGIDSIALTLSGPALGDMQPFDVIVGRDSCSAGGGITATFENGRCILTLPGMKGDLQVICKEGLDYVCSVVPEVVTVYIPPGQPLLDIPETITIPFPEGSRFNSVSIPIRNTSPYTIFLAYPENGSMEKVCENGELTLSIPTSIPSSSEEEMDVTLTSESREASCEATLVWGYEFGGEMRYFTTTFTVVKGSIGLSFDVEEPIILVEDRETEIPITINDGSVLSFLDIGGVSISPSSLFTASLSDDDPSDGSISISLSYKGEEVDKPTTWNATLLLSYSIGSLRKKVNIDKEVTVIPSQYLLTFKYNEQTFNRVYVIASSTGEFSNKVTIASNEVSATINGIKNVLSDRISASLSFDALPITINKKSSTSATLSIEVKEVPASSSEYRIVIGTDRGRVELPIHLIPFSTDCIIYQSSVPPGTTQIFITNSCNYPITVNSVTFRPNEAKTIRLPPSSGSDNKIFLSITIPKTVEDGILYLSNAEGYLSITIEEKPNTEVTTIDGEQLTVPSSRYLFLSDVVQRITETAETMKEKEVSFTLYTRKMTLTANHFIDPPILLKCESNPVAAMDIGPGSVTFTLKKEGGLTYLCAKTIPNASLPDVKLPLYWFINPKNPGNLPDKVEVKVESSGAVPDILSNIINNSGATISSESSITFKLGSLNNQAHFKVEETSNSFTVTFNEGVEPSKLEETFKTFIADPTQVVYEKENSNGGITYYVYPPTGEIKKKEFVLLIPYMKSCNGNLKQWSWSIEGSSICSSGMCILAKEGTKATDGITIGNGTTLTIVWKNGTQVEISAGDKSLTFDKKWELPLLVYYIIGGRLVYSEVKLKFMEANINETDLATALGEIKSINELIPKLIEALNTKYPKESYIYPDGFDWSVEEGVVCDNRLNVSADIGDAGLRGELSKIDPQNIVILYDGSSYGTADVKFAEALVNKTTVATFVATCTAVYAACGAWKVWKGGFLSSVAQGVFMCAPSGAAVYNYKDQLKNAIISVERGEVTEAVKEGWLPAVLVGGSIVAADAAIHRWVVDYKRAFEGLKNFNEDGRFAKIFYRDMDSVYDRFARGFFGKKGYEILLENGINPVDIVKAAKDIDNGFEPLAYLKLLLSRAEKGKNGTYVVRVGNESYELDGLLRGLKGNNSGDNLRSALEGIPRIQLGSISSKNAQRTVSDLITGDLKISNPEREASRVSTVAEGLTGKLKNVIKDAGCLAAAYLAGVTSAYAAAKTTKGASLTVIKIDKVSDGMWKIEKVLGLREVYVGVEPDEEKIKIEYRELYKGDTHIKGRMGWSWR